MHATPWGFGDTTVSEVKFFGTRKLTNIVLGIVALLDATLYFKKKIKNQGLNATLSKIPVKNVTLNSPIKIKKPMPSQSGIFQQYYALTK